MDAKIIVNGKEFPLGYKFITLLAQNLAPLKDRNRELIHAIAMSPYPQAAIDLLSADCLSLHEMNELWKRGNRNVRKMLLENKSFLENVSKSFMREMMELNDEELLVILIRNLKNLNGIWQLCGDMDSLTRETALFLTFLEHHPSRTVRMEFAQLDELPFPYMPSFSRAIREGVPLYSLPFKNMRAMDIDLIDFNNLDIDECLVLAKQLRIISDWKLALEMARRLAAHPDPEVRLALANTRYSHNLLKLLAEDQEEDIAILATINFNKFLGRIK